MKKYENNRTDPAYERLSNKREGCLNCGAPIAEASRPDKKFCCDSCRASYHNAGKYRALRCRQLTDKTINRNYKILSDLLKLGITQIPLPQVLSLGFNPHYLTFQTKTGVHLVNFCYDISYRISETRLFQLERILLNLREGEK